ncbi:MAG: DUF3810 domain-containing protein [Sphingobacteriales bacterium]|nr:MAG: DUF3810 domain-containing protein [Sphingobacteriales bacterium]
MKPGKKAIVLAIVLSICIIIRWYSASAIRVEKGYAAGFSPSFSKGLRYMFGKIPFSIGDILYGLLIVFLCWKLFSVFRFIYKERKSIIYWQRLKVFIYNTAITLAVIYIVFNIFWGINYNRTGIAAQLGLPEQKYTTAELRQINCLLLERVNESKKSLIRKGEPYPDSKALFEKVSLAYQVLAKEHKFLQYQPVSLKPSMWGWFGNYAGFTGYYNPFTGEAQVNTTIPKFLQPFTTCHEVAHQIGYAKEMEANFVGYLAAKASPDTLLHYSVYLDLFTYANRNLFMNDSLAARLYARELDSTVKADIMEWRKFNRKHQGKLEPVVRWAYGKYLQSNQQPNGISSYDEVTGFLIAYYRKFKKI